MKCPGDMRLQILFNVVFKWPGSVHDARIFANSESVITAYPKVIVKGHDTVPVSLLGDSRLSIANLCNEGIPQWRCCPNLLAI